jgi:nitrous oxide reductase accessory protein NosL
MIRRNIVLAIIAIGIISMTAFAQSDIDDHRDCAYCGMDRKAYGYSRMLVRYDDGTEAGVCSLHCAAIELDANKGRAVKAVLVADRDDRSLIPAEEAVWVIGGSKRGVMTRRPKWAFRTQTAAEKFIMTFGGTIAPWKEVLEAAREEAMPSVR